MRKSYLIVAALVALCVHPSQSLAAKDSVDYVSPMIGGIGQLLTSTIPYVQYPHGMARLFPVTNFAIQDRYLSDTIFGFPAASGLLMVSTGETSTHLETYASDYDHDFEVSTPYYYAVDLSTSGIKAELTAGEHSAYYRFTFPQSGRAHLTFSGETDSQLQSPDNKTITGSQHISIPSGGLEYTRQGATAFFYAEISRPFDSLQTWRGDRLSHDARASGPHIGMVTDFATSSGEVIEVRLGISYISIEQAHQNLDRESKGQSFEQLKAALRAAWSRALTGLAVEGGTERQRTIFYTALYRSFGRMTDIAEAGRYFSGYDHQVHNAVGHDFYIDDGLWDTYRSLHPLQLLLEPQRQLDQVRSYIRMYQQSGWLPSFPSVAGDQEAMIGHHAASLILDLYSKGYRDFDVEAAYAAMRKNALTATKIPWRRGQLTSIDHVYLDKGFFPALAKGESESVPEVTGERRQAVSVTLESAYDDWCVAQFARALGKQEDAAYFTRLANNYRNIYNPQTGWMSPRSADGAWVKDFDPKLGGGSGGRDYTTEMNTWVYTYSVQHDIAGLIALMGGREAFNARLDRLFVEQYNHSKFEFLGQFPDATGLVGNYAQGNEPSFHIPYLYDFSGQPWKTQKRVRQLMDVWYTDGPLGIPGDDDGGATSSWYVLSAIGFYPVCPGSPVYEIGSPIFSRTSIHLDNGGHFTIIAHNVSAQNKYIQSAQLNGKPLSHAWFAHADIIPGGSLVLEMGPQPDRTWGTAPEDAPPSMSSTKPERNP